MVEPAKIRAAEVLKRLPEGPVVGVEVGVYRGDMSVELLQRADLRLLMVDSWVEQARQPDAYRATGDPHARLNQQTQDGYYYLAKTRTNFAADRREIHRTTSAAAAGEMPDSAFDFVFIDADHSYEGARDDIAAWALKVKPGGWLCGHDYGDDSNPATQGVRKAVDEAVALNGWQLELGDNFTWFVKL